MRTLLERCKVNSTGQRNIKYDMNNVRINEQRSMVKITMYDAMKTTPKELRKEGKKNEGMKEWWDKRMKGEKNEWTKSEQS